MRVMAFNPIRVVHLSTTDGPGGAARAAMRLHSGLRRLGTESQMLVTEKKTSDPHVRTIPLSSNLTSRLKRFVLRRELEWDFRPYQRKRPEDSPAFDQERSVYGEAVIQEISSPDIVNLHWVPRFLDYSSFFSTFPSRIPIVWTLHDMGPFTGGCRYDQECGKWQDQCGACPQLSSSNSNDLSHKIWKRKSKIFSRLGKEDLCVVANSFWLAGQAGKSPLFSKFEIRTIHYGLDTNVFTPQKHRLLRSTLNIPDETFVILFVSASLDFPRKGFSLLRDSLVHPHKEGFLLLLVGSGNPAGVEKIPHRSLGYVQDDFLLSLAYNAADISVVPSLQEAFGQTALESLACGVPVVGFETGGIPDMVVPGSTGLLANKGDASDLGRKIKWMMEHPEERKRMGVQARKMVEEKFSLEVQARNYKALYEELLERKAEPCISRSS